ncbi:MAG: IPT/TIG domain-containing protein [Ardenticatenaceae bacterium]|nr:IPT/TIG domain-containing protein [Ardenticatenaceae bacterium]
MVRIDRSHSWARALPLVGGILLTALMVFFILGGAVPSEGAVSQPSAASNAFFQFQGTLAASETISPTFNATKTAIFSLSASNGTGPVSLNISDGSATSVWGGQAEDGETVWGFVELSGLNSFVLTNLDGGGTIDFSFKMYDVPAAPYNWAGQAEPTGENSKIKLTFPQSGLYEFDFTITANERYLFTVNDTLIQKTIDSAQTNTYYIPAGTHELAINQDSTGNAVAWGVDVTYTGTANDTTPFTQSGSSIENEEAILFAPAAAVQVNVVMTATNDAASLEIYDKDSNQVGATRTIEQDETVWQTYDLPAGANRIVMVADSGTLDYDLAVYALPTADGYSISGSAADVGVNSEARLVFADSGLYTFSYDATSGRYQFEINDEFIQKTVEGADSVTYFIPAGTHTLKVTQDHNAGADWGIDVAKAVGSADTLPYAKTGGDIGGAANDFDVEWLPVYLDSAADVNMLIKTIGDVGDSLAIDVFQGSSPTPSFSLATAYGTEDLWQTLSLAAGLNRIRIAATGADPLEYDLMLEAVQTAGTVNWEGNSLDAGDNSTIKIDFPTSGLYRFTIDSSAGFANLQPVVALPDVQGTNAVAASGDVSYDLQIPAGVHEVIVDQDSAYPETTWMATVAPVAAGPSFLSMNVELDAGESIAQSFVGSMDFNVSVTTTGGDVDVEISDGTPAVVWDESVIDGETTWGTGTLSGNNSIALTNNGGATVTASLVFYHIPAADGYSWDGLGDASGINSHIRVNFATDGLYTFDFGRDSGRYQFLLDDDNLQKTVESDGSSVTAFVTAGVHDLYLDQDTTLGADWDVAITAESDVLDTLPLAADGGVLGGPANDFSEEWLPVELGTATPVNVKVTAAGNPIDEIMLEVYDTSGKVAELTPVEGGESIWTTFDMPARGWLKVVADAGNVAGISYDIMVEAIPTAGTSFAGESYADNATNSQLAVNFPTSGLYTFDLTATTGQFQFKVNDEFILKTVNGSSSVAYYVPAGDHGITVIQDDTPAVTTEWSAQISAVGAAVDTLPYEKDGGDLGTVFTEEWLPVSLGAETMVNLEIAVAGADTDSLTVEIVDGTTTVHTFDVSGTETIWQAIEMPANARIHLDAAGAAGDLTYDIKVEAVASPTYTWSGLSLQSGDKPTFFLDAQVDGLYQVVVRSNQGFIDFTRTLAPDVQAPQAGIVITSEVELDAGIYVFEGTPSGAVNEWEVEVTLLDAQAPTISAITPDSTGINQEVEVTISGTNFRVDKVELVSGSTRIELTVLSSDGSSITATVPDTIAVGTYDVVVTNVDTQSTMLAGAFTVENFTLFLPYISR